MSYAQIDSKPKVLILNSNYNGFEWTDNQVSAAKEVLSKGIKELELFIEYMDTNRFSDRRHLEYLYHIYRHKYQKIEFSAIITTDDNALWIVEKHHKEVFGQAPVFFSGVNDREKALNLDNDKFKGVLENVDIRPTIDLALKLHPKTKRIVVLDESTGSANQNQQAISAAANRYANNLRFEFLHSKNFSHEELIEKLRLLPLDSIVLLIGWLIDRNNEFLPFDKGGRLISSNSSAPVYGVFDLYFDHGIVGGRLLSSRSHGRTAAEMAVRTINGASTITPPVISISINPYMFDFKQLQRWKINIADLPEDSIIINRPVSFYKKNKNNFFVVFGIVIFLSVVIFVLLLNIINRRKAEKKLRDSEGRFRAIYEYAPVLIDAFDENGRCVLWNNECRKTFRWTIEEINEHGDALSLFYPDPVIREEVHRTVTTDPEAKFREWHPKTKDGKTIHTMWANFRLPDGLTFNLGYDITEQKRAEKALRKSEKKLQLIFENSPIGIGTVDLLGNFISTNPTYERMMGYSKKELRELSLFDVTHPDYRPKNRELFQKMFSPESTGFNMEKICIRKDGTQIIVKVNAVAVKNDDGKTIFGTAFVEDITEQKRAEEDLKESILQQEELVKAANVGLWDWNLDTNRVFYSTEWKRQIGYDDHEIRDDYKEWENRVHPDELPTVLEKVRKSIDLKAKEHQAEFRFRHKDGSYRHILSQGTVITDKAGVARRMIGSHIDITERKKLETQLLQSQKLESIGTLAGGIAHDFNNILSSIIGFTELALDEVEKDSLIEDNLQEVYTAGRRAKELVGRILAFARQSEEELKPIQVEVIIKEVLQFIRSSIPTTVEIKKNIDSDSLIMGNQTQVHQIMMNLCTNAACAMEDEGGTLDVKLRDIAIDKNLSGKLELKQGIYMELIVSDTGTGIPPEIIDSIFEPYFTTKSPGEGTGMGLAMVQGIIESYGGKITFSSILGKGTTFTIYLPIIRKPKTQRQYKIEPLPTGTERVLYVDDEAPIAKMGSQSLERLGYKVTTRTSSVEALELFKSKPKNFDLVITDMTMPNMTGDKLALELMGIRPEIPVIICTGYSKKISAETASKIGIQALVYKPIVKADLAKTVRKVLDEAIEIEK